MDSTGEKICRHCGQDCAARARVKDAFGRYYCRECYDLLAQQQKQARSSNVGGYPQAAQDLLNNPLEDIISANVPLEVAKGKIPCPSCHAEMMHDAVLCTRCGYNRLSGEKVKTDQQRVSSEKVSLWHIPLGSISVIVGGIGLLDILGDMFSGKLGDGSAGEYFFAVFVFVLCCWVGYAGLGILLRRPGAAASLRTWSIVTLGLCILASTCTGFALAIGGADLDARLLAAVDDPGITKIDDAVALFFLEVTLVAMWPTLVILWLRRARVQEQISNW